MASKLLLILDSFQLPKLQSVLLKSRSWEGTVSLIGMILKNPVVSICTDYIHSTNLRHAIYFAQPSILYKLSNLMETSQQYLFIKPYLERRYFIILKYLEEWCLLNRCRVTSICLMKSHRPEMFTMHSHCNCCTSWWVPKACSVLISE